MKSEVLHIRFIKKRMIQQIKYMAEIEISDKPIARKKEILESARGVYEYFNKLHYEYDKANENIRTKE